MGLERILDYGIFLSRSCIKYYYSLYIFFLLFILITLSLVGGFVFQIVEAPPESRITEAIIRQRDSTLRQLRTKIQNGETKAEVTLFIQLYEGQYIGAIRNGTVILNGKEDPLWTFEGSVYYCLTTFSLVGYGNLAPKTNLGRAIAIIYCGFTIPVTSLILAELGELLLLAFDFIWLKICVRKPPNKVGAKKAGGSVYQSNVNNANDDISAEYRVRIKYSSHGHANAAGTSAYNTHLLGNSNHKVLQNKFFFTSSVPETKISYHKMGELISPLTVDDKATGGVTGKSVNICIERIEHSKRVITDASRCNTVELKNDWSGKTNGPCLLNIKNVSNRSYDASSVYVPPVPRHRYSHDERSYKLRLDVPVHLFTLVHAARCSAACKCHKHSDIGDFKEVTDAQSLSQLSATNQDDLQCFSSGRIALYHVCLQKIQTHLYLKRKDLAYYSARKIILGCYSAGGIRFAHYSTKNIILVNYFAKSTFLIHYSAWVTILVPYSAAIIIFTHYGTKVTILVPYNVKSTILVYYGVGIPSLAHYGTGFIILVYYSAVITTIKHIFSISHCQYLNQSLMTTLDSEVIYLTSSEKKTFVTRSLYTEQNKVMCLTALSLKESHREGMHLKMAWIYFYYTSMNPVQRNIKLKKANILYQKARSLEAHLTNLNSKSVHEFTANNVVPMLCYAWLPCIIVSAKNRELKSKSHSVATTESAQLGKVWFNRCRKGQTMSKILHRNVQTLDKTWNTDDQTLSKTLDTNCQTLSKTLDTNCQTLGKTLDTNCQTVSKTLDTNCQTLSKTLDTNCQTLSKTLDTNCQTLSKTLDTNCQTLSKTLDTNCQTLSKTLDTNCQTLSKTLDTNCQTLSKTLDTNCQTLSKTLDTNCQTLGKKLDTNCQTVSKTLDTNCQTLGKKLDTNCQTLGKTLDTNCQTLGKTLDTNCQTLGKTLDTNCQTLGKTLDTNCQTLGKTLDTNGQTFIKKLVQNDHTLGKTPDKSNHTLGKTLDRSDLTLGKTLDRSDHTLGKTVDRSDHTLGKTVDRSDHTLGKTLDRSDHTLGKTLDRSDHTLNKTLNQNDHTLGKTLDRSDHTLGKTLDRSDHTLGKTLDRSDHTLGKTLDRSDHTLGKTLDRSDHTLGKTLDRSDLTLGKRLDRNHLTLGKILYQNGQTLGRTLDRSDHTLGKTLHRNDQTVDKKLDRSNNILHKTLDRNDQTLGKTLERNDQTLGKTLYQNGQTLGRTLDRSDHTLGKTLDRSDHTLGKTLDRSDHTLGKTLDRSDHTLGKTLDRSDHTLGKTLDRSDHTLGKTLDRSDHTLGKTLDRNGLTWSKTLDRNDHILGKTLDRSDHTLGKTLDRSDHTLGKTLDRSDHTLGKTLDRSDHTLGKTLDRSDHTLGKTLDRSDHTLGKTLDRSDHTLGKTLDRNGLTWSKTLDRNDHILGKTLAQNGLTLGKTLDRNDHSVGKQLNGNDHTLGLKLDTSPLSRVRNKKWYVQSPNTITARTKSNPGIIHCLMTVLSMVFHKKISRPNSRTLFCLGTPFRYMYIGKRLRDGIRRHRNNVRTEQLSLSNHKLLPSNCVYTTSKRHRRRDRNNNVSEDDYDEEESEDEETADVEEIRKSASEPVLLTIATTFLFISMGSLFLTKATSNMSYFDSFWFFFISVVTIGYGDVVPTDQFLFVFLLGYIFIGLCLMSNLIGETSVFFSANVSKSKAIAADAMAIINTRKQLILIQRRAQRANHHWGIVRDRVMTKKIPRNLVEEAKKYKAGLLTEERELIRYAYKVYFKQNNKSAKHISGTAASSIAEESVASQHALPQQSSVALPSFLQLAESLKQEKKPPFIRRVQTKFGTGFRNMRSRFAKNRKEKAAKTSKQPPPSHT